MRRSRFITKLTVFKKKRCSHLYKVFVSVLVLEILYPILHEGRKYKVFQWLHSLPDLSTAFGTNHTCPLMLCFPSFDSSQYVIILSHSLMNVDFFYFYNRSWYSDEYTRRLHCISYLCSLGFVQILNEAKAFFSLRLYWENPFHLFPWNFLV